MLMPVEAFMTNTLVEFSNSLADAVESAGKSVVAIKEGGARGVSGTLWAPGVIVAAEHTLRGRDEFAVSLPSGESAQASVAGRDPGADIAVLKLARSNGTSAEFADSAQVRVGHVV